MNSSETLPEHWTLVGMETVTGEPIKTVLGISKCINRALFSPFLSLSLNINFSELKLLSAKLSEDFYEVVCFFFNDSKLSISVPMRKIDVRVLLYKAVVVR